MATIKDVARLAGVGLGTASRVISGKGSVSPATAARVRRAIERLEYRPSHAARSLLSGSSQTIGVYIPVLTGSFYTPILNTIDTQLRSSGQHMVVAFGSGEGDARAQAVQGIDFLIERGSDGVVAITDALRDEDLAALGPWESRLVVLNHLHRRIAPQCFSADHELGGRLAARALLSKGHERIAIIAGPPTSADNVARLRGFRREVQRARASADALAEFVGDYSPASGWARAGDILAQLRRFTAVFCANDEMAIGAMSRFHEAGLSIPQDLSVLGYDDVLAAEFSAPKLSTVHVPWNAVMVSGLNWLRNQVYGLQLPVERDFPVTVTWRSSVAPCPVRRTRRSPAALPPAPRRPARKAAR